jgi:hypothetical protein
MKNAVKFVLDHSVEILDISETLEEINHTNIFDGDELDIMNSDELNMNGDELNVNGNEFILEDECELQQLCVCHQLELCIKHSISKVPNLLVICSNIRKIFTHIKRSSITYRAFWTQMRILNLGTQGPRCDVVTRWSSTYYLLERYF